MTTRAQQYEIDKYIRIYGSVPNYRMGDARKAQAYSIMHDYTEARGSYLDVGCGRGEMLDFASNDLGFEIVAGIETVPELYARNYVQFGLVTSLPFEDNQFEVVTCLDVLEHLLPEDTIPALKELDRVASKSLFVTANNRPSKSLGVELHINKRPYHEWDELIKEHTTGKVEWVNAYHSISEAWVVTYD